MQLFIIDDDTPLNFQKHYRGIYLGEQKISQAWATPRLDTGY